MFTFILVGGNVALLMNNMLNNEIEMGYPFEISMTSADEDLSIYKDYINKNAKVKEMYEYRLYDVPNTNVRTALANSVFKDRFYENLDSVMLLKDRFYENLDSVMLLKDYNKLRQMLGYEIVTLNDNEAIIQCMKTAQGLFEEYIQENNTIKICDKNLNIKQVNGENFSQISLNGYTYCIVVPDSMEELIVKQHNELVENPEFDYSYKLVSTTTETTDEKFYEEIESMVPTRQYTEIAEYGGERFEQKI